MKRNDTLRGRVWVTNRSIYHLTQLQVYWIHQGRCWLHRSWNLHQKWVEKKCSSSSPLFLSSPLPFYAPLTTKPELAGPQSPYSHCSCFSPPPSPPPPLLQAWQLWSVQGSFRMTWECLWPSPWHWREWWVKSVSHTHTHTHTHTLTPLYLQNHLFSLTLLPLQDHPECLPCLMGPVLIDEVMHVDKEDT